MFNSTSRPLHAVVARAAMRRALALLAAAAAGSALLGGVGTSAASADYRVYNCEVPGRPDVWTTSFYGWSASASTDGTVEHSISCGTFKGMVGRFKGGQTVRAGSHLSVSWVADYAAVAKEIRLRRTGFVRPVDAGSYTVTFKDGKGNVEGCVAGDPCWSSSDGAQNLILGPDRLSGKRGQTELTVRVTCDAGAACSPSSETDAAGFGLNQLEFVLDDQSAPKSTDVQGTLTTARFWRGSESLTTSTSDQGSGVRGVALQRRIAGDWKTERVDGFPGNKSSCEAVDTNRGIPSYVALNPCASSLSADITVETAALPDGIYRAGVTDASGNVTPFVADKTSMVDRTAPTIEYADVPGACVVGGRVNAAPTVTDEISGVATKTTTVTDADGQVLAVDVDGRVLCPPSSKGPLTSTTTAQDEAGNARTTTRRIIPTDPGEVVSNPGTVIDPPGRAPAPAGPTGEAAANQSSNAIPLAPHVSSAPTASATAAADALLACSRTDVLLTEAYASGKRDVVRGVANKRFVGQTVTIASGTRKKLAAVKVAADGTFSAKVKPAKGKNSAYRAVIGTSASTPLKRTRRLFTTAISAGRGGVSVAGRITGPLAKRTTVSIQFRGASCSSWKTVKTVKATRRGGFSATVPAPADGVAVVVRAVAKAKASASSTRQMRLQALPAAVKTR